MPLDGYKQNENGILNTELEYSNDENFYSQKEVATPQYRSSFMTSQRKEESFDVDQHHDSYDEDDISHGHEDDYQPEEDNGYRELEKEQRNDGNGVKGGGEADTESQGEFHLYDGEEYRGSSHGSASASVNGSAENEYPDWRTLQQDYLQNRQKQRQKQALRSASARRPRSTRDASPMPRQYQLSVTDRTDREDRPEIGDRLYLHALEMKRKKDLRYQLHKQKEEEVVKPKLCLVTQQNIHPFKKDKTEENRSNSTPRYLQLYDQRISIKKKKKSLQKEYQRQRDEENKLRLETRPGSRSRHSASVPRFMHLYERAKVKQMQETSKKNKEKAQEETKKKQIRRNTTTPQRITRLYEMTRKSQQEGRQRRDKIEKELRKAKQKPTGRSVSVNRRAVTEPLEIGLYDRGMAKKRVLEMKRARAAAERDDPNETLFKSPLLNPVH